MIDMSRHFLAIEMPRPYKKNPYAKHELSNTPGTIAAQPGRGLSKHRGSLSELPGSRDIPNKVATVSRL